MINKHNLAVIQKPPQKDLIDHLKVLLGEAECGELQGIAYAALYRGHLVGSSFTALDCPNAIIGALFKLQHKIMEAEHVA